MTTPVQLLLQQKKEIRDQYNRVLAFTYQDVERSLPKTIEDWRVGRRKDLTEMKNLLDKYNEALNILKEVGDYPL